MKLDVGEFKELLEDVLTQLEQDARVGRSRKHDFLPFTGQIKELTTSTGYYPLFFILYCSDYHIVPSMDSALHKSIGSMARQDNVFGIEVPPGPPALFSWEKRQ